MADDAGTEEPDEAHHRPPGVDDATVEALGMLTKALEYTERARGHLYAVHHMTGGADRMLADAVRMLRQAGYEEQVRQDLAAGRRHLAEAEMQHAARSRRRRQGARRPAFRPSALRNRAQPGRVPGNDGGKRSAGPGRWEAGRAGDAAWLRWPATRGSSVVGPPCREC
ncbi:hypothetical protein [Kitasatospora aureofaciens]|uniref:hypothetical protein n=1 Tax=Kitasatospora aureofaciens TaxID=1894 RepID=UPI00068C6A5E